MAKPKTYELTQRQKEAWTLLENPMFRRYLFDGGARSGKTDGTIAWLVYQAAKFPGARILVARYRLDHARTTIWNLTLKKILPPGCNGVRYLEGPLEARFPNGSVIRVGGLDDAERVDKILGDEYLHIFINEATQTTWDTVTKVLTRLSQNIPGAVRKLVMDCNPKGPRHWLHQVGVQHIEPSSDVRSCRRLSDADVWARLHFTPYDNPYIPKDTLATLEALPGIMRRRMLLGEWCNNDAFEAFQRYCDETATLVILGQLATSDKAGGLSNNGAQDKVRQDILEADCSMVLTEMQKLVNWLLKFRYGIGDGHDFVFSIDCEKPEDMNIRAERDAKVAAASGCVLDRKYAEETYGIRLEEKPETPYQEQGVGQFADYPIRVPKRETAVDRTIAKICDNALQSIVDPEALEAWRGPVDDAVRKAFGDLDPSLPDEQLLAAFAERAPGFLESLPGVMDAMDDRVLVEALGHSMLAGYVNGLMPADFWKKRPLLKEEGVAK